MSDDGRSPPPAVCGGALGVWINTCGTGDALSTAHALAGAGVSFVNSDFQATFLQA